MLSFLISCSKDKTSNNSYNENKAQDASVIDNLDVKNFLIISQVLGQAYILRENDRFGVTSNTLLDVNDTIVTERGFVVLTVLPENSVIRIMANSRFSINNFLKETLSGKALYEFDFKKGKIMGYINNQLNKTDVRIISRNNVVAIRGTIFMVEERGDEFLVILKKGRLDIYNKNNPNENFTLEENNYAILSDTRFNDYQIYSNLNNLQLDNETKKLLDDLSILEENNKLQANSNNSNNEKEASQKNKIAPQDKIKVTEQNKVKIAPQNKTVTAITAKPIIAYEGKGTREDPFIINNSEKLQAISLPQNLSKSFKLVSNLNLQGKNFLPIGNKDEPFTGSFDGNGFTINNLTINTAFLREALRDKDKISIGLFGFAGRNSLMKNIKLENVNIESDHHKTGALVGRNNGLVLNSFVSGSVSGPYDVGGLVGYNNDAGQVINSLSRANVQGNNQIGGLVGYNGYGGYIKNSYSQGQIQGNTRVGGLIGINDNAGKVENSYSISKVSGREQIGGLIGYANKGGSALNAFWDTEASAVSESSGGTGRKTKFIQSEKVVSHFGLDEKVWEIKENSYPKLFWE